MGKKKKKVTKAKVKPAKSSTKKKTVKRVKKSKLAKPNISKEQLKRISKEISTRQKDNALKTERKNLYNQKYRIRKKLKELGGSVENKTERNRELGKLRGIAKELEQVKEKLTGKKVEHIIHDEKLVKLAPNLIQDNYMVWEAQTKLTERHSQGYNKFEIAGEKTKDIVLAYLMLMDLVEHITSMGDYSITFVRDKNTMTLFITEF